MSGYAAFEVGAGLVDALAAVRQSQWLVPGRA